jgi:glc operon protein GlcG
VRNSQLLTRSDAEIVLAECLSQSESRGWAVSIAVVDAGGFLLHLIRMDGAGLQTPQIAELKARTAALTRLPTGKLERGLANTLAPLAIPGRLPMRGGVPIIVDGDCIGAVAASGVLSEQDEEIALLGVARLLNAPHA